MSGRSPFMCASGGNGGRNLLLVLLVLAGGTLRAATNLVPPEMELGLLPHSVPEPSNNPSTPQKVALGRLLFFDPILSATGDVACATCHHPRYGWADGRAVPIGVGGVGIGPERIFRLRNDLLNLNRQVPSLLNVAFNGLVTGTNLNPAASPMFWDARVSGLEAQVAFPLRARDEMRGDVCAESDAVGLAVERVRNLPAYREAFSKAFAGSPEPSVNATNLARAIAAFERTLVASESPFDRFLRGDTTALNTEEQRGLQEFRSAGCILCHGGPMFSDFKLHVLGVPDSTSGGRRAFRTPTLRQVSSTAPYMHNGGFRTLDEVLEFYEELMDAAGETLDGGDTSAFPPLDPLLSRLNVRPENSTSLKAFLEALQDNQYDRSLPTKVPSGLPVGGQ